MMSLGFWVLFYLCELAFWLWIIKGGGAEWLEGSLLSGFVLHFKAPSLDADGLKAIGWLCLIGCSIWFVLGLAMPELRF